MLFAVAGGLGVILSFISGIVGPKKPNWEKEQNFECGSPVIGNARERFGVKFYVVALLFIVFDVEIIFLYPWAVYFSHLALFGLVEMVTFILTVFVVYAYVWRRGGLEWD